MRNNSNPYFTYFLHDVMKMQFYRITSVSQHPVDIEIGSKWRIVLAYLARVLNHLG